VPLSWFLVVVLFGLMGSGFFVLRSGRGTGFGNEMNVDRAVFTVVNAATLTGFQQPLNPDQYKPLGQATVFALMCCGTLVALLVGGWGLARALRIPYTDWQIAQATILIYLLSVLAGAATLLGPGVDLRAAVFQAVSAFGNVGLTLGATPTAFEWRTHVVLLPLAVLGGLSVPVILDVASSTFSRRTIHDHTRAALWTTGALYLLGTGTICIIEMRQGGATLREAAILSSTETLNSRTLGMPLGAFGNLARSSQWIALVMMIIGACPAGTSGGLKTTTLLLLAAELRRLLGGGIVGRAFGVACLWFGSYFILVLLTTILLVAAQPQVSGEKLLFLAVSAASNVGTSVEPVGFGGAGLYILSVTMLVGRLLPLALLWKLR
jgi:Trk-type K+ transport system membrane component